MNTRTAQESLTAMREKNPAVIARNHNVEAAITAAVVEGDLTHVEKLVTALRAPFTAQSGLIEPPLGGDDPKGYATFCGT
jgi:uncharacterized protein YdiU (UPF0061 family)